MFGDKPGIKINDIGYIAVFISLPTAGVSALSTFALNGFESENLVEDFLKILDFIFTSFPLTLAAIIITFVALTGEFSLMIVLLVIIIAGLLANLLGMIIPSVAHTHGMGSMFRDSLDQGSGIGIIGLYAFKIVNVWWRDFGPIMFIQSVVIGGFIGYRIYSRLDHEPSSTTPLTTTTTTSVNITDGTNPAEITDPVPVKKKRVITPAKQVGETKEPVTNKKAKAGKKNDPRRRKKPPPG